MVCRRQESNAISEILHTQDHFILLHEGRSLDELNAGMVLHRRDQKDRALAEPAEVIFTNYTQPTVKSQPYRYLHQSVQVSVTASVAAELAQVLSHRKIDVAKLKGLFRRSTKKALMVSIDNAERWTVSRSDLQHQLFSAQLTDYGRTFENLGDQFFVVLDVITATAVSLRFTSANDTLLQAMAEAPEFAEVGLKTNLKFGGDDRIELEPGIATVIAFRAAEILPREAGGYELVTTNDKISILGEPADGTNDLNIAFASLALVQQSHHYFTSIATHRAS